jgi:AraC-like DNA-binding protein
MPEPTNRRLAELLEPLITQNGFSPTPVAGVEYIRATEPCAPQPFVYAPWIAIVAQGAKRVWLGEESYRYDANNYLVFSAPMPVQCETIASEEEPLLGLIINVDPIMVGELLLELGDVPDVEASSIASSSPMTAEVIAAAEHLAETFASPVDARILGPQIVREIVYRVLVSENGPVLRLATSTSGRFGQIARVIRRIHQDYATDLDVEALAKEVSMATSTFHAAFRQVTATSPLQYLKQIRLHRARALLTQEGVTAQEAAGRVGYGSATQFSREYRRMFGVTPGSDRAAAAM